MIGIGIIGFGYWGPNLARNFFAAEQSHLVAISDLQEKNLRRAQHLFPGIKTTLHFQELIVDPKIDVIAIATPVATHFELALAALEAGKHVWLEKPMCANSTQAQRLIEAAQKSNLVLHVDHTFVYTGAIRKIKDLVTDGTLGNIQYYDSTRINLGLFQRDVDVIWDLAIHDFAILDFLLDARPVAISANGLSHVPGSPENLAYITLFYGAGMIAHVNVNWMAPVKIRNILLGGDKKMIVYDDLHTMEKIKIYDKGIQVFDDPNQIYKMRIGYRIGDMYSPNIDPTEALHTQTAHFLDCVQKSRQTQTDGEVGLRVVHWLETATASMKQQGTPIPLTQG